jgi:hypothetical protein
MLYTCQGYAPCIFPNGNTLAPWGVEETTFPCGNNMLTLKSKVLGSFWNHLQGQSDLSGSGVLHHLIYAIHMQKRITL